MKKSTLVIIPKTKLASRKGVQGARVEIIPEKEESFVLTNDLIQKGKVIGAGVQSKCKVGNIIIFEDWLVKKIVINEEKRYFVDDTSILYVY